MYVFVERFNISEPFKLNNEEHKHNRENSPQVAIGNE